MGTDLHGVADLAIRPCERGMDRELARAEHQRAGERGERAAELAFHVEEIRAERLERLGAVGLARDPGLELELPRGQGRPELHDLAADLDEAQELRVAFVAERPEEDAEATIID